MRSNKSTNLVCMSPRCEKINSTILIPFSAGTEGMASGGKEDAFKLDKESSLIVDMILDEEEYDDETNAKLQEYIMGEVMLKPPPPDKLYHMVSSNIGNLSSGGVGVAGPSGVGGLGVAGKGSGTVNWGAPAGWVLKDLSLPGTSQHVVALKQAVKSGFVPPQLLAFKGPVPGQWETLTGSV